jgi:hypothetical protein
MMNIADYGSLGHGEVVGVDIPKGNVKAFADQYFALFGKDSERPDKVRLVSNYFCRFCCHIKPRAFPYKTLGRPRG